MLGELRPIKKELPELSTFSSPHPARYWIQSSGKYTGRVYIYFRNLLSFFFKLYMEKCHLDSFLAAITIMLDNV